MTEGIIHSKEARWNWVTNRYALRDEKDEEEANDADLKQPASKAKQRALQVEKPSLPTKTNPMHLTVYGMLCLCCKSYQSALCRFHPIKAHVYTEAESPQFT